MKKHTRIFLRTVIFALLGIVLLAGAPVLFPRYTLLPLVNSFTPLSVHCDDFRFNSGGIYINNLLLVLPQPATTAQITRVELKTHSLLSHTPLVTLLLSNGYINAHITTSATHHAHIKKAPTEKTKQPLNINQFFPLPTDAAHIIISLSDIRTEISHPHFAQPLTAHISGGFNAPTATIFHAHLSAHSLMNTDGSLFISAAGTPDYITLSSHIDSTEPFTLIQNILPHITFPSNQMQLTCDINAATTPENIVSKSEVHLYATLSNTQHYIDLAVTGSPTHIIAKTQLKSSAAQDIAQLYLPNFPVPTNQTFLTCTATGITSLAHLITDARGDMHMSLSNTIASLSVSATGTPQRAHTKVTLLSENAERIARIAAPNSPQLPGNTYLNLSSTAELTPLESPYFVEAPTRFLMNNSLAMCVFTGTVFPTRVDAVVRATSDAVGDIFYSYMPHMNLFFDNTHLDFITHAAITYTGTPTISHAQYNSYLKSDSCSLPDFTTFKNTEISVTGSLIRPLPLPSFSSDDTLHYLLSLMNLSAKGYLERIKRENILVSNIYFTAHVESNSFILDSLICNVFDGIATASGSLSQPRVKNKKQRLPLLDVTVNMTNISAKAFCETFKLNRNKVHARYTGFISSRTFGKTILNLNGKLNAVDGGTLFLPDAKDYIDLDSALAERDIGQNVRDHIIAAKLQSLEEYEFKESPIVISYNRGSGTTHVNLAFFALDSLSFPITFHGTWLDALNLAQLFK